jgi:hypothetical protein
MPNQTFLSNETFLAIIITGLISVAAGFAIGILYQQKEIADACNRIQRFYLMQYDYTCHPFKRE